MSIKAMFLRPVMWGGEKKKAGDEISKEEFDSIPVANRKALVSTGKISLVEMVEVSTEPAEVAPEVPNTTRKKPRQTKKEE